MSDFVNTVDIIGDEALTDSIIEKSVVEIKDNHTKSIGEGALYQCPKLTTVDFLNVTTIGTSAFERSSALSRVDFPSVTLIRNSAFKMCSSLVTADFPSLNRLEAQVFNNCGALTTLILRSGTMAIMENSSALGNTKIAQSKGYIYVPRALLSDDDASKDYRRATNWSTYANQFRALEDYTVDGTTTGELDWDKINAA